MRWAASWVSRGDEQGTVYEAEPHLARVHSLHARLARSGRARKQEPEVG
jgi:hypothetical protein